MADVEEAELSAIQAERYRATVQICPECLSLYDGSYKSPRCEYDGTLLASYRVKIAEDD